MDHCQDHSGHVARIESVERRVDSMEKLTESVVKMSMSIEAVVEKMDSVLAQLKNHGERIDALEDAPGVIAVKGWLLVGGMIATAVISYLLGKVGL